MSAQEAKQHEQTPEKDARLEREAQRSDQISRATSLLRHIQRVGPQTWR
jgi:hypothetical protein